MALLRARVGWSRPKSRRGPDLTPEEQTNVRAAVAFLAKRRGGWKAMCEAMGLDVSTVRHAYRPSGGVSPGMALRVARAAGVPLEDVLAGRWPKPGMCPHCGRG
jgi:hypothetical protein